MHNIFQKQNSKQGMFKLLIIWSSLQKSKLKRIINCTSIDNLLVYNARQLKCTKCIQIFFRNNYRKEIYFIILNFLVNLFISWDS